MKEKERLFLHSCCGPCSTAVVERLIPTYKIILFFYNPNITDREEYVKRLEAQKKFLQEYNATLSPEERIELIEGQYEPQRFLQLCDSLKDEPEGGARCTACFFLRLQETAKTAKAANGDLFATTLSVSPHKDINRINEIGKKLEEEEGIPFLPENFKKKDGYVRSIQMSKDFNIYRQNYCGCQYSIWWK